MRLANNNIIPRPHCRRGVRIALGRRLVVSGDGVRPTVGRVRRLRLADGWSCAEIALGRRWVVSGDRVWQTLIAFSDVCRRKAVCQLQNQADSDEGGSELQRGEVGGGRTTRGHFGGPHGLQGEEEDACRRRRSVRLDHLNAIRRFCFCFVVIHQNVRCMELSSTCVVRVSS